MFQIVYWPELFARSTRSGVPVLMINIKESHQAGSGSLLLLPPAESGCLERTLHLECHRRPLKSYRFDSCRLEALLWSLEP